MATDSELSSDGREEEFLLYSQLYFGNSNEDSLKNGSSDQLPSREMDEENDVAKKISERTSSIDSDSKKLPPPNTIISPERTVRTRERNPSICSTGSISGKQPLDDLYCIAGDSDGLSPIEEVDSEEAIGEFTTTNQKNTPIISKPLSKYNMSASKFSKSIQASPKLQEHVILISDKSSSDDDEVVALHFRQKNKGGVALEKASSDESIVFLQEKNAQEVSLSSPNKKMQLCELSSDSSTDSDDALDKPLATPLFYNVSKTVQNSITALPNKKRRNLCKGKQSKVIYSKYRELSKKTPSCQSWTLEMTTLYDSDISEDLTVEEVHSTQSDYPHHWKISGEDYPSQIPFRYFTREPRCERCRQFGHEVNKCPRVPLCPYCGSSDHTSFYKCPNNCCLRCGGEPHRYCPQTSFTIICHNCGLRGHCAKLCPDAWRKFHKTTKGTIPIVPEASSKRRTPWCCNCAKRGHYGSECFFRNSSQKYVIVPTTINTYKLPFQKNNPTLKHKRTGTEFADENARTPNAKRFKADTPSHMDSNAKMEGLFGEQMQLKNDTLRPFLKKNQDFDNCEIKKRFIHLKKELYGNFQALHHSILPKIKSATSQSLKIIETPDQQNRFKAEIVGTTSQRWLAQHLLDRAFLKGTQLNKKSFIKLVKMLKGKKAYRKILKTETHLIF